MNPTVDEIAKAREDLHYEIEQLAWCAELLLDRTLALVASVPVRNAILESMLVHARGLLEFLWERGRYDRDIAPEDLAPQWPKETLPAHLKALKERMDKQLAHLTYDRPSSLEEKGWNVPALVMVVLPRAQQYCELAHAPFPDIAEGVLSRCALAQTPSPALGPVSQATTTVAFSSATTADVDPVVHHSMVK